jgi:hypothetical protein
MMPAEGSPTAPSRDDMTLTAALRERMRSQAHSPTSFPPWAGAGSGSLRAQRRKASPSARMPGRA